MTIDLTLYDLAGADPSRRVVVARVRKDATEAHDGVADGQRLRDAVVIDRQNGLAGRQDARHESGQAVGQRAIAAWLPRTAGLLVSTGVTALIFMWMHGAGDPWLNAFYLLFAVAASVLS